jgi:hypothetical protein
MSGGCSTGGDPHCFRITEIVIHGKHRIFGVMLEIVEKCTECGATQRTGRTDIKVTGLVVAADILKVEGGRP